MRTSVSRLIERLAVLPVYEVPRDDVSSIGGRPVVRLDRNENLFLPEDFMRSVVAEAVRDLDPRTYSQADQESLIHDLAEYVGVEPSCVLVGAGSDDLIGLLTTAFLRGGGGRAVTVVPTFSMYRVCAARLGAGVVSISLQGDFELDVDTLLADSRPDDMLFLCSPNNPTGNQYRDEDILRLMNEFEGVLVLDEAYAEFGRTSFVRIPMNLDNVIVLRTMSKAFGLASLRLGYCVANNLLVTRLRKHLQPPYPVSSAALLIGRQMLRRRDVVLRSCDILRSVRDRLFARLHRIPGVIPYRSDANFILLSCDRPSAEVAAEMRQRGFVIRDIGQEGRWSNLLRVTVPPEEVLDPFVAALEEVMSR
ncbi:MAG: histidinol-phosphate transaminase [Candidatus Thorarchaeota archaeon]